MIAFRNRITSLLRLPIAGAFFVWGLASHATVLVLLLYLLGAGCIVAGVWEGSQPWGKAVLGISFLVTAVILARMRR